MPDLLINAFIVYVIGLFLAPCLPPGKQRRLCELIYAPAVRLGLWYRWSMYSPDVPTGTQIALAGVVLADGSFQVVPLPGLDDDTGFGRARGLRFVAFQWALCDPLTDHLKPALAERALKLRERGPSPENEGRPVAVEIRVYDYPSPRPGESDTPIEPHVRTVWARELTS